MNRGILFLVQISSDEIFIVLVVKIYVSKEGGECFLPGVLCECLGGSNESLLLVHGYENSGVSGVERIAQRPVGSIDPLGKGGNA